MPNRISIPVCTPASSLEAWDAAPYPNMYVPQQTVEWEAEVVTFSTYGSSTIEYERIWWPTNLRALQHWPPAQLAEMRQKVICHAEANGMPTKWSEPAPTTIYPPIYGAPSAEYLAPLQGVAGQQLAYEYDQMARGAFMANNNGTWADWTSGYDTTASTSSATNFATLRASSSTVWHDWSTGTANMGSFEQPTPEQLQARQERSQELQAQARETRHKKKQAKVKAEKLLLSLLDSKQKKEFSTHRTVSIQISPTQVYKLAEGRTGNILETNPATGTEKRWCVHIRENVPNLDNIAGQLLHLRTDPAAIMDMANAF